jgi:formyl-CoA transferase
LFGDAHLWERGLYHSVLERDGTPRMLPGLPWRWGDESLIQPKAAPALGQHSQQVLRDLAGLTDSEIEALRMAGALGAKSEA